MVVETLGHIEKQVYFSKKISLLTSIYKDAQRKLNAKLMRLDLTNAKRYRTNELLKEVDSIIFSLNRKSAMWAKEVIPLGYERGFDITGKRMSMMGIATAPVFNARIHTSAINVLIDDTTVQLITANESMGRTVGSYIRRTQQLAIQDSQISKNLAEGLIQGEALRGRTDRIVNAMKKNIDSGKFITINGRHYDPVKYARMLAQTRTREAVSQATINTALQYDMDLVQISAHSDSCPYCLQFQGRVFSISGSTKEFLVLSEYPPYHPYCEHIMAVVTDDFLKDRYGKEGHENLQKLSNTPKVPDKVVREITNNPKGKDFQKFKEKYKLVESFSEYERFVETGDLKK